MRDRVPLFARAARALLTHPERALRLLGAADEVWRDGRRLHRGLQLLLVLGERTGATENHDDVERARADMRRIIRIGSPSRRDVHAFDRRIPGPAGDLAIRVYRRFGLGPGAPVILYAHGGGFVVGDLDTHDPTCRLLAAESGCVVVAVDYRLAPEHPFPAAVDDQTAAYAWVRRHASELGADAGRVAVMGDSAGATLSAAVCLEARRLDLPAPDAQCLVYPMTDARFRFGSYETFATGFSLTLEGMEAFRARYARSAEDWTHPCFSPLCAEDLSGLPPAVIVTAGFDPLRDDGEAYADALAAAGVPVTYRCYDDFIHGFHGMMVLPEAEAAGVEIARQVAALLKV